MVAGLFLVAVPMVQAAEMVMDFGPVVWITLIIGKNQCGGAVVEGLRSSVACFSEGRESGEGVDLPEPRADVASKL
ncbi:hypothetical protein GCM10009733_087210 [Nonomuraea maheshkhaliensis]|uniref:Uncharacterized protein n=1 Tax=Nonomuraea maheshkhaliensis TaxID=419590 RepID=A0ABP4ST75_9ACTN